MCGGVGSRNSSEQTVSLCCSAMKSKQKKNSSVDRGIDFAGRAGSKFLASLSIASVELHVLKTIRVNKLSDGHSLAWRVSELEKAPPYVRLCSSEEAPRNELFVTTSPLCQCNQLPKREKKRNALACQILSRLVAQLS